MEDNQTTWIASRSIERLPKLEKDIVTDVLIVGGGLTGTLCAYVLAKAGRKVTLLEKSEIATGTTMYTTAFLTEIIDTAAEDVYRMVGLKRAKLVYASHRAAISLIEKIVNDEKIDCDFRRMSNTIIAEDEGEAEDLEDEYDIFRALDLKLKMERNKDLGFHNVAALEIMNQATFDPIKFISGLVPRLKAMGVDIYEHTEVISLSQDGSSQGVLATANGHTIRSDWSLTATYQPFNNPASIFMKKGTYISYVFELEVPKGRFREGMYEDMKNPYHYFRIVASDNYDRIILGGEDHRKEIPMNRDKNWKALEDFAVKTFGHGTTKIVRRWHGRIIEPSDGFGLIGLVNPRQILATAFSGNGMTYAGITALMTKDIIEQGRSEWDVLYRPKRLPTFTMLRIKARDYIGEFIRGALRNMIVYGQKFGKKVRALKFKI